MKKIAIKYLNIIRDWLRRPRGFKSANKIRFGPRVKVSRNSQIQNFSFIGARSVLGPCKVEIGRYSSIGPDALIGANKHPLDHPSTSAVFYSPLWGKKIDLRAAHNDIGIMIEDDVWIGTRSIIMPGVTIGRGAVVAAGSVVTKNVAAYSIVGGVPAKFIRARFSELIIEDIEKSRWWEFDPEYLITDAFLRPYSGQKLVDKL